MRRTVTSRPTVLVAVTAVLAAPFALQGARSLAAGEIPYLFVAALMVAGAAMTLKPIKLRPDLELNSSDVVVLIALLYAPAGIASLVGAAARIGTRLVSPRPLLRGVRDVAAVILSAGLASLLYGELVAVLWPALGQRASVAAGVLAAVLFIALELIQAAFWRAAEGQGDLPVVGPLATPTGRAHVLWLVGAVGAFELVRVEPLFLVPAFPLLALAYMEIRGRFVGERRALFLQTAVDVSHAVGSTLDTMLVFRAVYGHVRSAIPVDAFFVALANKERTRLSYRFLVDTSEELEPRDREFEGTLAGHAIQTGEPILLRDAEHDRLRIAVPRAAWGTVEERSILVAPLRVRGEIIGAISAQSAEANAYDRDDLELIQDIANEAAIAIERADLHERTTRLSQRLFDLHRVGVEIVSQRDVGSLARRLARAAGTLLSGTAAVYVDDGSDVLARADAEGDEASAGIPKSSATTARALAGQPVEIATPDDLPEAGRAMLLERGLRSVLVQPLRVVDESVGVLYVAWDQDHVFTNEERELAGVVAGLGATALRGLQLYDELEDAYLSTITTLTATIQAREGHREDHLRHVAANAVALGQRLGLPDEQLRSLRYAALFHSLGKIAVPSSILSKPGPLTPDERRIMQEHPVLGAQIIGSIRFLEDVAPLVRHASERWDGQGYPDRLGGEAIPRLARILHIAVAYHAMIVDRPYRPALSREVALLELRSGSGVEYDPTLVEDFARMIETRGAIAQAELEIAGARELAILSEVTPEFHTLLDLQQMLERVLGVLEKRMPGTRLAIMLEDAETGDLVLRASAGSWSPSAQRRLPKGRGVSGWVMQHAQTQLVDDVRLDPRWITTGDDTRSALVIPLLAGGRAIGVLGMLHQAVGAFGPRDVTLMQAVAGQLAAAVEVAGLHERLKVVASTDALTGLHNYRYLWDRLDEEISRADRRSTFFSVGYLDLDKFKRINDQYGHIAGDTVLRALGRAIAQNVRHEDIAARYGGEEFAIVMPETPRDEADKAMARLMEILDHTQVEVVTGKTIPMPSRSWGVATYPLDGRTARELIEAADTRVYAAKRSR
ncbi:MAG: diguanylate cyclase [Chloroflexi bacterium]|nr:diguanylate cyclase [Chloroflexota bacterium]